MWSRKVVWWLALKLIIRDQVLFGDDGIKSLGSGGVCLIREKFLYLVGYTELVVKRLRRFTTSSVRHWHLRAYGPKGERPSFSFLFSTNQRDWRVPVWWRVEATVRGQVMDPAAHKPIHFSSIFSPPRRVFGAKMSAKRVHISNAKRAKA